MSGSEVAVVALIYLMIGLVAVAIPIIAAIWVYNDAKSRQNDSAAIWAVGTVLAWFAVLIVYLIVRPDYRDRPC